MSAVSSRTSANCRTDTLTQAPFWELQTYGIQALCLMLGEYLDAIGLIIFYESLRESSYNPIKLICFVTY